MSLTRCEHPMPPLLLEHPAFQLQLRVVSQQLNSLHANAPASLETSLAASLISSTSRYVTTSTSKSISRLSARGAIRPACSRDKPVRALTQKAETSPRKRDWPNHRNLPAMEQR